MIKNIRLLFFALSFFVLSCSNDDSSYEYEPQISISGEIQINIGSEMFTLSLYDNKAAQDFRAMLPLSLNMNELNGNEKYYDLPSSLPTSLVRPSTIHNGDLMLYGNRTLVLFYKSFSNSYNYSRIGRVNNPLMLENALGEGNVTVRFEEITSVAQYTQYYSDNKETSGNVSQTVTAN